MTAGCARSGADSSTERAEAQIRSVILSGFVSALASEGPIERAPWLVREELDGTAADFDELSRLLNQQFPAYDREAFAELRRRLNQPGQIDVPATLQSELQLVDDATASSAAESNAMAGHTILRLSPVGLNPARTRAVVIFDVACGPGCGARQLVFLSGNRKRWIPIQRVRLPLSDTVGGQS